MKYVRRLSTCVLLLCLVCAAVASAQRRPARAQGGEEAEFGPIVRAYLGYLSNQQEVVDDRVSRREIDRAYYLRNSARIRALRQMAVRIARETRNDYLPELEAVAQDEFGLLFDLPPEPHQLIVGEVFNFQFRYLGPVASGREQFYLFARLDPYEQAELRKQAGAATPASARQTPHAAAPDPSTTDNTRPRRVGTTPPR